MVNGAKVVGSAGFDVVRFDNLKPLHARSTGQSREHASARFNDSERPSRSCLALSSGVSEVRLSVGRLGDGRGPSEARNRALVSKSYD